MQVNIELTIDPKNVNCGPPLGPKIIPFGVDVNKVVKEIKYKTKNYDINMIVLISINLEDRSFKVSVKKPEITTLIKKYVNENKIRESDLKKIKHYTKTDLKQLLGTCKSMHLEVI